MSGWQDALKGRAVSAVYRQRGFGGKAPVEPILPGILERAAPHMERALTQREADAINRHFGPEVLVVEGHTPSTPNTREHWAKRAKRTKSQRDAMKTAVHLWALEYGLPQVVVTLTRVSPRAMDAHDNLRAALKPHVDGIADALGIDDSSQLVRWEYAQRKGAPAVEVRFDVVGHSTWGRP